MKRAIITGANGFVGSSLAKYLVENEYYVYAIVRSNCVRDILNDINIEIIEADYDKYIAIQNIINGKKIDLFIHLAWEFSGNKLYDTNIQIENIRGACEAAKLACDMQVRRFVFISSFFEHKKDYFYDSNNEKYEADSSIYGKCKSCASDLIRIICQANRIEFVSIMLSNIFGWGDYSWRAINTIIKNMIKNVPVPLIEGTKLYDYLYIDDAVAGIKIIAEKGKNNETYYLGNRELKTFKVFIEEVKRVVNDDAELLFGEFKDDSFISFDDIDLKKAYSDTGFLPQCDFNESIRKTENWVRLIMQ